jgi:hypothetical protein
MGWGELRHRPSRKMAEHYKWLTENGGVDFGPAHAGLPELCDGKTYYR